LDPRLKFFARALSLVPIFLESIEGCSRNTSSLRILSTNKPLQAMDRNSGGGCNCWPGKCLTLTICIRQKRRNPCCLCPVSCVVYSYSDLRPLQPCSISRDVSTAARLGAQLP
jgi:hypothetical protein